MRHIFWPRNFFFLAAALVDKANPFNQIPRWYCAFAIFVYVYSHFSYPHNIFLFSPSSPPFFGIFIFHAIFRHRIYMFVQHCVPVFRPTALPKRTLAIYWRNSVRVPSTSPPPSPPPPLFASLLRILYSTQSANEHLSKVINFTHIRDGDSVLFAAIERTNARAFPSKGKICSRSPQNYCIKWIF